MTKLKELKAACVAADAALAAANAAEDDAYNARNAAYNTYYNAAYQEELRKQHDKA